MRNIVLVCNMGMSTSLMVNKMRAAAKAEGYDCQINAYALQKAAKEIEAADIILVGPQLSFELPKLKTRFPAVALRAHEDVAILQAEAEAWSLVVGECVVGVALDDLLPFLAHIVVDPLFERHVGMGLDLYLVCHDVYFQGKIMFLKERGPTLSSSS